MVAPEILLYVPSEQTVHSPEPGASLYVPEGQTEQFPWESAAKPALHTQAKPSVLLSEPGEQPSGVVVRVSTWVEELVNTELVELLEIHGVLVVVGSTST